MFLAVQLSDLSFQGQFPTDGQKYNPRQMTLTCFPKPDIAILTSPLPYHLCYEYPDLSSSYFSKAKETSLVMTKVFLLIYIRPMSLTTCTDSTYVVIIGIHF